MECPLKNLRMSVFSAVTVALMSSAFAAEIDKSHLVTNKTPVEALVDSDIKLKFISEKIFSQKAKQNFKSNQLGVIPVSHQRAIRIIDNLPSSHETIKTDSVDEAAVDEESLYVGIPIGLIGEQNIFGGVITKISDNKSELLGGLKLTDLPPVHVKTIVARYPDGSPGLTLVGCANECDEESQIGGLGISFPIMGVDEVNNLLIVDLASIGKELNLLQMMDPNGEYTKLKTISSATTSLDYSYSTLVFDIKSIMVPVTNDPAVTNPPTTEVTVRWYIKLGSIFNPMFKSRNANDAVGFFETSRAKEPKITRFSITKDGKGVHYYIKNVPTEYRQHFSDAIKNWNTELQGQIGRDLLSFEFLEKGTEKYDQIVAGDIRYNVIEWDLDNKAGYGGLGPSISNQMTGETISANVLIQGPTIIDMYSRWFKISQDFRAKKAAGNTLAANQMVKEFNLASKEMMAKRNKPKFSLKLGSLDMTVHSQKAELEDPMIKGDFELVPEGMTWDTYMAGYFKEMIQHEIGHNLGLRHNFKGSLGATSDGSVGSVSRSIMEYLGRSYRHLNAIGEYDKMTIAYGYKGVTPKNLNWYCTDEHEGPVMNERGEIDLLKTMLVSPECTKLDATSDPFSYWESRLERVVSLLVEKESNAAPVWKVDELNGQINELVIGFSLYGISLNLGGKQWNNFFDKPGRPTAQKDVRTYMLGAVKNKLCDPALNEVINTKETAEGRELALNNMATLKFQLAIKFGIFGLYSPQNLTCDN